MEQTKPRPRRQTDPLDPARATALARSLGLDLSFETGDPLPPFFHQIYFWNSHPPQELGRDGHPNLAASSIPDLDLPRRMWAGGRLRFHVPLQAGHVATCETDVVKAERKTGRTGPLGLVTLRLTYQQFGATCVEEERDLIYRAGPRADSAHVPAPAAPAQADVETPLTFDTTLLFRYSALTFNGHRIHYDLDYAREVEGYSGLVAHGPLLAQHLMLLAEAELGPLRAFTFRATAPLFHTETATACLSGTTLFVRAQDGRMCMKANAEPQ